MIGFIPQQLTTIAANQRSYPSSWRDAAISILLQQHGHVNCPICHRTFVMRSELRLLEADHRLPWSLGGLTTWENLEILCRPCNRKKSNQLCGNF